jgi:Na+/citrate or Na+/malate symporter
VHLLMKEANFLYFVIACLVVGSILGMNRTILIQGMVRMFVPLVVGTGAAIATGLLVGSLFGYSSTTPSSLLSCRLSAAALAKGSCAVVAGLFGDSRANA